jgi:hypothetical protein
MARTSRGKQFASTVMPDSLQPLRFAVTATEVSEFDEAITDAITGAAATLMKSGATKAGEDFAGRYLRDNSLSKLTGNINTTSVQRLQDAIAGAWDAGGSYDQIVEAITGTFADFAETRAGLIAQTEVADAYNSGRDSIARGLGFAEKAWETESGDPCQICIDNEDAGWIDIDEDFPSGDGEPTAHPNCLCVVNFRRSSDEE